MLKNTCTVQYIVQCTPTNYVDRKHLKSKLTTKIHLKSMLTKKALKQYVDKENT